MDDSLAEAIQKDEYWAVYVYPRDQLNWTKKDWDMFVFVRRSDLKVLGSVERPSSHCLLDQE